MISTSFLYLDICFKCVLYYIECFFFQVFFYLQIHVHVKTSVQKRHKKHAVNLKYSINCTMHLKKQSLSLHSVITFFVYLHIMQWKRSIELMWIKFIIAWWKYFLNEFAVNFSILHKNKIFFIYRGNFLKCYFRMHWHQRCLFIVWQQGVLVE